MGQPVTLSVTLATADDNGIAESQSPAGAGDLTLDGDLVTGGVAVLATAASQVARQVIITSGGNDTGITFTIYGTNSSGVAISETLAGADQDAASSVNYYATVTRIAISGASAGTVIAGTNGVGVSRWSSLNIHADQFSVGVGVVVTDTVNYTFQYTYDNPEATNPVNGALIQPTAWDLTALASKSANTDASISAPVHAVRLKVNSGTGTAAATYIQAGLSGS